MSEIIHKTKEQNTFRFKSFATRIDEIDLRRLALYYIGHENEQLEEHENETHFHQTLKKWIVLNLTEEFNVFSRKCQRIVTLPQLIHQKDAVIDALLERLSTASNLSLQPLLELLYVLARDLRADFYPYFQRVLDRLVNLLNTQDAEQLEWTFVCLAHLFKALKPYLRQNIGVVFNSILPLLDEQRYEEHVTNFAVECFSFIAREVPDYKKFMDFVLETVAREQVQAVQGCGRLLFEIMRGVKGQFHSTAGRFLGFILDSLINEEISEEKILLLGDIVDYALQQLLKFIHTQNMSTFWLELSAVAGKSRNPKQIERLLPLFLRAASYRNGKHLLAMDVVVPAILDMIEKSIKAKEYTILQQLGMLISKIVLSGSTQLTQLDTTRLIKKMLTVTERDLYAEFVLLIVAHPQFEFLVLPAVVAQFETHFDLPVFQLMSRIVLEKQPLAKNAINLANWKPYDIHLKKPPTLEKILSKFENVQALETFDLRREICQQLLLLCILAPHIKALRAADIETHLKKCVNFVCEQHQLEEDFLPIFALLFENALHLGLKFSKIETTRFLEVLLPSISGIDALNCLDLLLASHVAHFEKQREKLMTHLSPLLSSHQREVRKIAVHCLKTLHSCSVKCVTPYECLFAVASIAPNLQNYREQLLHLQKLETGGELYKSIKEEHFKLDVLRFLFGLLYENFKLVWEPTLQLFEEYAKCMPVADFWTIYKIQLEQTAAAIIKLYSKENSKNMEIDTVYSQQPKCLEFLGLTRLDYENEKLTQQELMNYRNLLWQRLPKFGTLAEQKNRELIILFFDFLQNEYRCKLQKREHTWDLLNSSHTTNKQGDKQNDFAEDVDEEVESDDDADDNEDDYDGDYDDEINKKSKRKRRNKKSNPLPKLLLQTLQIKLGIFSAQPNPKALYREPELNALYMELLAGSNTLLQKEALNCILAYKSKDLVPLKEHLYALNDEEKFKNELINFKLDTLAEEQRVAVMPILLRLLYGKMLTRGTQRALSAQARKSLILRFLSQCTLSEVFSFLQMAFGRYDQYTDKKILNLNDIPKMVQENFALNAAPSAKKLKSIVNLLELIRKEFGGIMGEEFHIYMLKLLVYVGSSCQAVLDNLINVTTTPIQQKILFVYRKVKQAALLSLVNFFEHIDKFDWQDAQIECFTEVFVWPNITKLSQDCLQSPTPLLKLLLEWGQQPRLFKYFNQKQPGTELVIFHYIIELLLNERAKSPVQKPLMSLVERLLVSGSNSESNESDYEISNMSLTIIKPFIPKILQRLKQSFKVTGRKQMKHKLKVDKQQLNILSLLTTYVEDSDTCENLLELMLPVLVAKSQASANDETLITQVIITLKNLIRRLNAPETQLLKIAPLFEFVQDVGARKLLCELVVDIASKRLKQAKKQPNAVPNELCERLKEITRFTLMLNAWDKRWVEQPDYDKRLDALKQLSVQLEKGHMNLDLGVLVIYNCCYYLRYDKDMGLRDNASEHMKLLFPKLTQQLANEPQQLNYLVGDIFINLARRLIGDAKDNIRNEGIRLLGAMACQCGYAHVILKDLAPLTDRNDEEADFFENLTHLQTQRHGRALLKFCTYAATLKIAPATRTLTEFVLPLATRYLLQEKYTGKHTLIDAAIEALGVACQLLPWQQYHAILRYYLQKMRRSHEYQKQCVRIVVRILDAFHFDLTAAQNGKELAEKIVEQAKKEDNEEDQKNKGSEKEDNEANDDDDLVAALEEAESHEDDDASKTVEIKTADSNISTVPLLNKATPLSFSASKRILTTINSILIPTLNRAITERSQYDTQHKVNRRRIGFERESEEILRVPIALALIKLMQKLPKELMENGLPGVFMKVCTFLRSPLKSVRMLTREILKKIMLTLGSSYLPLLVEHLQSLLTRGFQVHVLTVTIHGVLDALRGQFKANDIDNCLGNLLEVALNDIFGDPSAEKEVPKIATHTPEAKPSAKSYLVLHIAARNIQESSLLDLLLPFKDHLARSHARKLILKIQECFAKIVSGLVENPHISRESLLVFIYGMISESIVDLLPGSQKRQLSEKEKEKMRRARPDCFIIQPTPQRRQGAVNKNVKSNAQANAHILIEFGLELLHIILKRKKLAGMDHQAFLNPLLPLLRDALKSSYIRVTTFTLKCFAAIWNNEYDLPELDEHLPVITARMFEILKNLSSFGASKQEDNIQLIKSTLKTLVALLRQCPQYTITPEQIDQLVLHIEQDLYEGDKQPLSFALLKALIGRKVDTPTVHGILKQIAELSITSQSDYVRDECRNLLLTYVMEYTLHKRVDQLIKNFAVQLCYTVPTGRMSAIQFMAAVIKRFPQQILSKRAEFLYLSLGTRLVNDDDSTCRKAVAECIESLLMRLEKADRHRLFEITALFFEEAQKPAVREMAASLCSRFVNVEKRGFVARLTAILPVIVARLAMNDPRTPGKFVRAPAALGAEVDAEHIKDKQLKLKRKGKLRPEIAEQDTDEAVAAAVARKQRSIDHEIIQMQYCMHKMLENCLEDILKLNDETLLIHIDELAYTSQRLLAHEHAWVRSNAAKTIGQILAHSNVKTISLRLCGGGVNGDSDNTETEQSVNFIHADPANDIKSLVLDLCAQLVPGDTPQAMIDEMAKIFLLIANMLRSVPFEVEKKDAENDDGESAKINLKWLLGRIRFLSNKEMAKAPHCVTMRTALFNLIEGLITLLSADVLVKLAPMILSVLVREMSEDDQQIDPDLRQLALRVGSRLRKAVSSEVYDKLRTRVQTSLLMRRAERKKIVAQEKIHDPVNAAKRKAATQERKKAAKKRKTDVMRGKVEDVKQKLKKRKRKAEKDDLF